VDPPEYASEYEFLEWIKRDRLPGKVAFRMRAIAEEFENPLRFLYIENVGEIVGANSFQVA
jgi:hypothetical protein